MSHELDNKVMFNDGKWLKISWDKYENTDKRYLVKHAATQSKEDYYLIKDNQPFERVSAGYNDELGQSISGYFSTVVDIKNADFILFKGCCGKTLPSYFSLLSQEESDAQHQLKLHVYLVFYAIVGVMWIYNLFIFFYLRDSRYLIYCAFLFSIVSLQMYLSGIGKQFLWFNLQSMGLLASALTVCASLSQLWLYWTFLNNDYFSSLQKKAIKVFSVLLLLPIAISLLDTVYTVWPLLIIGSCHAAAILSLALTNYLVVKNLLLGDSSAYVLLFTHLVNFVCAIVALSLLNGWVSYSFWSAFSMEFGITFEAVFLSLVLAQKIQRLRQENLDTKAEQLSIQQRFSQKLLTVQEEEKKKIGDILHDSFTHKLLLLKNDIDRRIGKKTVESNLILEVLDDMRNLSRAFHPHMLKDLGLEPALQDMIERINQRQEIDISLAFDDVHLTDKQQILIYRIVQESLNNVIKHAYACECFVSLSQSSENNCLLLIVDDGKGFDVAKNTTGMGLKTLQERADMLNGKLTMLSSPDGTNVRIEFPTTIISEIRL